MRKQAYLDAKNETQWKGNLEKESDDTGLIMACLQETSEKVIAL
jgi:hypothetical protein